jgi:large subunit ribosomal protein L24e
MVVKRQCSFCADEIEPGTGTMFVKRDGSIFHFCSSSCRKQQLHLGRVGHRLKWTRAHSLKVAAEQSHATAAKLGTSEKAGESKASLKSRGRTTGAREPVPAVVEKTPEPAPESKPVTAPEGTVEPKTKARKPKSSGSKSAKPS